VKLLKSSSNIFTHSFYLSKHQTSVVYISSVLKVCSQGLSKRFAQYLDRAVSRIRDRTCLLERMFHSSYKSSPSCFSFSNQSLPSRVVGYVSFLNLFDEPIYIRFSFSFHLFLRSLFSDSDLRGIKSRSLSQRL